MSDENGNMRERILLEAARLLRRHGYENTTLRDIAKNLEIKAGSIYYHFSSKEDILIEVLDKGIDNVFLSVKKQMALLSKEASPRDFLVAAIEGHLRGVFQYGDFSSANIRTYRQAPDQARQAHRKHRKAYSDFWHEIIANMQDDLRFPEDIETTQRFLMNALNVTVEWYDWQDDAESFDRFIAVITGNILNGIVN